MTRTDSKGRRKPARKPERRMVPAENQKRARQVAKRVAAATVESEVNEVARLRGRIQEHFCC